MHNLEACIKFDGTVIFRKFFDAETVCFVSHGITFASQILIF